MLEVGFGGLGVDYSKPGLPSMWIIPSPSLDLKRFELPDLKPAREYQAQIEFSCGPSDGGSCLAEPRLQLYQQGKILQVFKAALKAHPCVQLVHVKGPICTRTLRAHLAEKKMISERSY